MSYRKILVAVDNSEHSDRAVELSVLLAGRLGASLVGVHVYAARLHDRRFAQLEPSLPAPFQEPARLEASRRTHDSLIGDGLRLISESYLDVVERKCGAAGVAFERRILEGKNYRELVREIGATDCDLAVFGSRGIGAMNGFPDSDGIVGSVAMRAVRRIRTDALVVKNVRPLSGRAIACTDGSATSSAAVHRALNLAAKLDLQFEAVAAFDPAFHTAAFGRIARVLSGEAAHKFRFHEQQQTHDQVIDKGLERLYEGYLDGAALMAQARGVASARTLLKGSSAVEIVRHARESGAALLVLGRTGAHRTDDTDLGATAENVLRLAPCHVLLTAEPVELGVRWTPEAEARLANVPPFVRPMVARAVESYALARGIEEITARIVEDAKKSHGLDLPGH